MYKKLPERERERPVSLVVWRSSESLLTGLAINCYTYRWLYGYLKIGARYAFYSLPGFFVWISTSVIAAVCAFVKKEDLTVLLSLIKLSLIHI